MISPGVRTKIQHPLDLLFHYVFFSLSSSIPFPIIDSKVQLDLPGVKLIIFFNSFYSTAIFPP